MRARTPWTFGSIPNVAPLWQHLWMRCIGRNDAPGQESCWRSKLPSIATTVLVAILGAACTHTDIGPVPNALTITTSAFKFSPLRLPNGITYYEGTYHLTYRNASPDVLTVTQLDCEVHGTSGRDITGISAPIHVRIEPGGTTEVGPLWFTTLPFSPAKTPTQSTDRPTGVTCRAGRVT